ncbi:hypothetical protein, partial [Mesorhizobium sp.]|uniref:hypothetical protein n=1 Tax=Mesorhizobium sp. TaxID=1871066 RepID=UPI00257D1A35
CDLSRETLNLPHMMGLPNRTLEPISRSWSFCANAIEARSCTGSGSSDDLFEIALRRQSFGFVAEATIPSGSRGGYWQ